MSWLKSRRMRRDESAPPPSTSEYRLTAAIEAAQIIERHCAGEDGDYEPRVFIVCPELGGMFLFHPDEAMQRIGVHFPDLDEISAKKSARHLTSRVRSVLTSNSIPDMDTHRPNRWMDWRDESESLFRF